MRDRWTAVCERLVPEALRATAFDPAVADLRAEASERTRGAGRWARFAANIRLASGILAAALECRRLHAASVPAARCPNSMPRGPAMWTDFRNAARSVRRSPALTVVVVLILAVGIGANVAVFSFANTYLIAPLPVDAPDRLVRVYGRTTSRALDTVSYPDYRDARDALAGLRLAAHAEGAVRVGPASARLTTTVELVSGNFFEVMRVAPRLGRLIAPADDLVEGAHPVIVIGETFWRAHFGGDPALVGRTVAVNGVSFEVIGIAPAGFRGASSAYAVSDLWVPLAMHGQVRPRGTSRESRTWGWLSMIGRLADGASIPAVQVELDRLGAQAQQAGAAAITIGYDALPAAALPESDRRRAARVLGLASGLTTLVLIAACANLAGVMQTRLQGRRRELAVRRALGAGPAQLVRMLFFEALLLAGLAGAGGLAGGRAAAGLINRWRPPAPLIGDLSFDTALDWRVLAFTIGVTAFCAVAFGLLPALAAARASSSAALKDDGPTSTNGRRGARIRRAAVTVQVGIAVMLLLAGGLLLRSALTLNRVDPGFDTRNLAVFSVDLRSQHVPADEGRRLIGEALRNVRRVQGVASAGIAGGLPLGFMKDRLRVRVPGFVAPDGASGAAVAYSRVGGTYFQTLGIRMRRGQPWDGSTETSPGNVVVINDTMARTFWGGRDPLGSSLEIVGRGPLTVVGIASDSTYYELGEAPMPFMYLPAETALPAAMSILARTTVPVAGLLSHLEREIAAVDDRIAPSASAAFDDLRGVPLYPARAFASIAVTFGALALLLTAVGLYGVVAGAVGQRTREFGVRLALGARSGQIQGGVIRDACALGAVGVAAGLGAGYFASDVLRAWLYGVAAFDLPTYVAVAVLVAAVTLGAAWVPARRASRTDPVAALRM